MAPCRRSASPGREPTSIELDGRKIVGSAQRRHGKSFLQHGSILLGIDAPRVAAIFPATRGTPPRALPPLERALGRRPDWDACVTAIADAYRGGSTYGRASSMAASPTRKRRT
jgi:lipoate-protein ligase A